MRLFDQMIECAFIHDLARELDSAERKHGRMHSPHEAYAVILEELDEFWEICRRQQHRKSDMRKELLQVAAMGWRACRDLGYEENREPPQ